MEDFVLECAYFEARSVFHTFHEGSGDSLLLFDPHSMGIYIDVISFQ